MPCRVSEESYLRANDSEIVKRYPNTEPT